MAETEAAIHRREEEEEEEETPTVVRIFVGGLGESVTDDDLRNIFSSSSRGLGKVETVEIIRTKGRSFAYMNFFPLSHNSLSRLFSTYNGCVWKGGKLRLEKAKDDYLSRLKKEWDEDAQLASLASEKVAAQKLELPSLPTKEDLRDQKMVIFFPRLGKVLLSLSVAAFFTVFCYGNRQGEIQSLVFMQLKTLPLIGTGKHKYSFRRVDVPPLPKHFCDCEEHCDYVAVKKRNPDPEDGHDGLKEQEINLMNSVMNRLLQRVSGGKPSVGAGDVDVEMAKEEHREKEPAVEEHHPVDSCKDLQVDIDSESDEDNIVLNIVSKKRKLSSSTSQEGKDSTCLIKEMKSLLNGENNVNEIESSQSAPQNSERSKSHSNGLESSLGTPIVETGKEVRQSNPSVAEKKRSSWKELVGNGSSSTFSISEVLPQEKVRKSDDIAKSDRVEKSKLLRDETQLAGNDSNNQLSISGVVTGVASNKKEQSNSDDIVQTSPDKDTLSGDGKSESKSSDDDNNELSGDEKSESKSSDDDNTEMSGDEKSESESSDDDNNEMSGDEESESESSDDDNNEMSGDEESESESSDDDNNEISGDEESQSSEEEEEILEDVKKASTSDKTAGRGSAWLNKSSWTQLVSGNNSSLFSISQILPGGDPEKQEPAISEAVKVVSSTSSQVDDDKGSKPVQHLVVNQEERNAVEGCAEVGKLSVADKNDESEEKVGLVRKQLVGETCSFMRSDASIKEWQKAKAALSGSRKRMGAKAKAALSGSRKRMRQ
ncbi:Protein REPRESSOR OF SILENCING 3 [Linum grandiflorum]